MTKANVLEIEELQYQLAKRGRRARDPVGIPHRRLYIQSGPPFELDEVERDHLCRFLSRLASDALHVDERATYRSILNQVANQVAGPSDATFRAAGLPLRHDGRSPSARS